MVFLLMNSYVRAVHIPVNVKSHSWQFKFKSKIKTLFKKVSMLSFKVKCWKATTHISVKNVIKRGTL
jgi:hypothetical protein